MSLWTRAFNALDRLRAKLSFLEGPELRLYAVVSQEAIDLMKGNRGKLVAQGGHAFLHSWWDALVRYPASALRYRFSQAAAKIVLVTATTADLTTLYDAFEDHCGVTLVKDAGRTVFKEPTVTYVGIGPITKDDFSAIAPGLKVLI